LLRRFNSACGIRKFGTATKPDIDSQLYLRGEITLTKGYIRLLECSAADTLTSIPRKHEGSNMSFDIQKTTEQVEQGHGCFLKGIMDDLPDSDARLDALRQIQHENATRRHSNSNLPQLTVDPDTWRGITDLSISRKESNDWTSTTLYNEHFIASFPKHRAITCKD
jgi:hypothetical protein